LRISGISHLHIGKTDIRHASRGRRKLRGVVVKGGTTHDTLVPKSVIAYLLTS
jgi:hypothetical protein